MMMKAIDSGDPITDNIARYAVPAVKSALNKVCEESIVGLLARLVLRKMSFVVRQIRLCSTNREL